MTPHDEIRAARISDTAEIVDVDGRRAVVREDGSKFYLDVLSDPAYWGYMARREAAWNKKP